MADISKIQVPSSATVYNLKDDYAVRLAGDTLTGNLSFNLFSSTQTPFKIYGGNANGQGISVGAGAATIVGAGESAKECESLLGATSEQLWLTSDSTISFYTNCDTIGNKVGAILDGSRNFYPDVTNSGSLGTSSHHWNTAYINNIEGNLAGNAATASQLAHLNVGNGTTIDSTAGTFAFSGNNNYWAGCDWVGLQVGDSVDKFQIVASDNGLVFRQNDSGGTNTSWQPWVTMLTSSNYTSYTLRYINTTDVTTWTADTLAATDSIAFTRGNVTGAYTTGHIVWLNANTIGTPFQLVVHDSSDLYLYKRYKNTSTGVWNAWTKMNAGYADSAGILSTTRTIWGQNFNGSGNVTGNLYLGSGFIYFNSSATGLNLRNDSNTHLQVLNGTAAASISAGGVAIGSTYATAKGFMPTNGLYSLGGIKTDGEIWIRGGSSDAGGNANRLTTTSGMPSNMQYQAGRRGTKLFANGICFADPYNGNGNSDAAWIRHIEETANQGYLEIAVGDDASSEQIYVRQYNTSNGIARSITLLDNSGNSSFPGMVSFCGNTSNATYTSAAIQIREAGYAGAASDTWAQAPRLAFHWSGRVAAQIGLASNSYLYECPGTGSTFYKLVYESGQWGIDISGRVNCNNFGASWIDARNKGAVNCDVSDSTSSVAYTLARIRFPSYTFGICSERASNQFGIYGWTNSRTANGTDGSFYISGDMYFRTSTRIYGAVWNDFAEYRQGETTEGGRAVYDDGNGIMRITTQRMQPASRLTSDTYGFAVGESNDAHTPIGVGGRVLAYPYQDRNNYKVGDAVCSAPNGTVDIMSREEIKEYPDRIIGIVSEIPTYEIWETQLGTEEETRGNASIPVKGRIWVYVR